MLNCGRPNGIAWGGGYLGCGEGKGGAQRWGSDCRGRVPSVFLPQFFLVDWHTDAPLAIPLACPIFVGEGGGLLSPPTAPSGHLMAPKVGAAARRHHTGKRGGGDKAWGGVAPRGLRQGSSPIVGFQGSAVRRRTAPPSHLSGAWGANRSWVQEGGGACDATSGAKGVRLCPTASKNVPNPCGRGGGGAHQRAAG